MASAVLEAVLTISNSSIELTRASCLRSGGPSRRMAARILIAGCSSGVAAEVCQPVMMFTYPFPYKSQLLSQQGRVLFNRWLRTLRWPAWDLCPCLMTLPASQKRRHAIFSSLQMQIKLRGGLFMPTNNLTSRMVCILIEVN